MSGITKCHGTGCPLRDNCYRFTVPAHPLQQSYAAFACDPEKGCEYFIDAKARREVKP